MIHFCFTISNVSQGPASHSNTSRETYFLYKDTSSAQKGAPWVPAGEHWGILGLVWSQEPVVQEAPTSLIPPSMSNHEPLHFLHFLLLFLGIVPEPSSLLNLLLLLNDLVYSRVPMGYELVAPAFISLAQLSFKFQTHLSAGCSTFPHESCQ